MGGMNLKRIFGERALSVFVAPPSVEELERRLIQRATDAPEKIKERILKAEEELMQRENFDLVIVNDDLRQAQEELLEKVNRFLSK
jgi:guanylate kinase